MPPKARVGLIIRGVAFEFRSKHENPQWRKTWDVALFVGSLLSAVLWGVAFANIVRGVPIDASMTYTGTFFNLLNPFALLGGLVTLALFCLHGALFLSLKTTDVILERVKRILSWLWIPTTVIVVAFVGFSIIETDLFVGVNLVQGLGLATAVIALLVAASMITKTRYGSAFMGTGLTLAGTVVFLFGGLFPRVMPSTLGSQFDLTIYLWINAYSAKHAWRGSPLWPLLA